MDVSTVPEIKIAIQNLSVEQRRELISELPMLLPELDGDADWERIIRESRPRPALSALLDESEDLYRRNPVACVELSGYGLVAITSSIAVFHHDPDIGT